MFASTDYALPRNPEGNSVRRAREADSMGPLTILAMFAIAAFCGVAIPYLGIMAPAIIGALALSAVVLALSPLTIIWLMLVLVLLVVGQLTFFLGIYQAIWLPYLLLLLIAVKSVMEQLRFTARTADTPGLGAVWVLIILFCLLFCLSALANKTGFAAIGVAGKNYLFPWFLTLLVASAIPKTDDLRNVWKFMLWVAMLQVLFAIPQHFYFAKQIGADWDAIVGSFGGNYLVPARKPPFL
jgi:hypothetical protein